MESQSGPKWSLARWKRENWKSARNAHGPENGRKYNDSGKRDRPCLWVIFTVRKHFTPKLAAAEKANTYDLNRDNPEAKRAAQRRRGPLAAARWALRVAGWAENVLAVLMIAWLAFLLGAILTGTFFVFGYPV